MPSGASKPMVVSGSSMVHVSPLMPTMSPLIVLRTTPVVDAPCRTSRWCGNAIMSNGPAPVVSQSNVMVPTSLCAVAPTVPPVGMRAAWASSVDSLATSSKAARKEPVKGLDACSAPPLSESVMGEDA